MSKSNIPPTRLQTLLAQLLPLDINFAEFIFFPELPREIRTKIWKHAANVPRRISNWTCRGSTANYFVDFTEHYKYSGAFCYIKSLERFSVPPLIHANSEARNQCINSYKLLMEDEDPMGEAYKKDSCFDLIPSSPPVATPNDQPRGLYVNFELDVWVTRDLRALERDYRESEAGHRIKFNPQKYSYLFFDFENILPQIKNLDVDLSDLRVPHWAKPADAGIWRTTHLFTTLDYWNRKDVNIRVWTGNSIEQHGRISGTIGLIERELAEKQTRNLFWQGCNDISRLNRWDLKFGEGQESGEEQAGRGWVVRLTFEKLSLHGNPS